MRVRAVIVVYSSTVVDHSGNVVSGGAEIYLSELSVLALRLGYQVTLVQCGPKQARSSWNGVDVRSVAWRPSLRRRRPDAELRTMLREFDRRETLVVFGSEGVAFRLGDGWRSLLIQHGIGFDYPTSGRSLGPLKAVRATGMAQSLVRWEALRSARSADFIVCVDYIYPTWLMTFDASMRRKVLTIPNFARLSGRRAYRYSPSPRILFARRLVERRGALLMANAIKLLRSRGADFQATFAGHGDAEEDLKAAFGNDRRVEFRRYPRELVQEIHSEHDIAVVPSLASEGTSFSLLEAMAAGCAVVATGVGGLTNVVIDGHNGLLCAPDPDALADAIGSLVRDQAMAARLARTGYETVEHAFGFDRWCQRWETVLTRMFELG